MENLINNTLFKRISLILGIILILFIGIKTLESAKKLSYIGKAQNVPSTINVSGKGEITTTPDIATFSFTVTEEAATVGEAQKKATDKMNALLAYVKKSDVSDKDVKTLSYTIYPRYDYQGQTYYNPGKQVLAAYVVSQTIELKVRKLENAGTLLTGIGEFGATNVSGLSFLVDKQDELVREARDKAITDAKNEAVKLAKALGVKLGSMTSFYESSPYYPISPIYYSRDMAAGNMMSEKAAPQIPSGENKIVSNVTITYEIK